MDKMLLEQQILSWCTKFLEAYMLGYVPGLRVNSKADEPWYYLLHIKIFGIPFYTTSQQYTVLCG